MTMWICRVGIYQGGGGENARGYGYGKGRMKAGRWEVGKWGDWSWESILGFWYVMQILGDESVVVCVGVCGRC